MYGKPTTPYKKVAPNYVNIYGVYIIIWAHGHEHAQVYGHGDVEQHVVVVGEKGVFEVHGKVQDGQHSRRFRRVEDEAVRVERAQRDQPLQRAACFVFAFSQKSSYSVKKNMTYFGIAILQRSAWYIYTHAVSFLVFHRLLGLF